MEIIEKIILWIFLSNLGQICWGGSVTLNGPPIETSDLRAIDGYVSSGLPLFAQTKGFILHSGMRPVIVKVKDPNKEIRDGIEQPNQSYYRNLPSVIPEGYEGIASTSFQLGQLIGSQPLNSQFVSVQPQQHQVVQTNLPVYQQQPQQQFQYQQQQPQQQQYSQQQQQPQQYSQQLAEPSFRVENRVNPQRINNQVTGGDNGKLVTNPVVVETSTFEANLPQNLQNPFYSNQMLAYQLARESLPAPGEEVVAKWDTNKIRSGKVRDLLVGAGFIS